MARFLLSLLGYRFDVEVCRNEDPDMSADLEPGSCTTYPVGFCPPEPAPMEADFPDRY